MLIEEIISNALDLAGGSLVRQSLDADQATLVCLNVIDTMMLELANSSKGIKGLKVPVTFSAGVQSSELEINNLSLGSFFVRFREFGYLNWQLLEVVDDIEDLTRRENAGSRSVMISGANPFTYFLSWTPEAAISAELWGNSIGAEVASLNALPPFPVEFGMLCAYRVTDFVLNQLLALDARRWQPFVVAQKQSIFTEAQRHEFIWRVYRSNPASAKSLSRVKPYDMDQQFRNDREDERPFWN